jgi:hypothetical protein
MPAVTSSAVEAPEKPEGPLRLNHHIRQQIRTALWRGYLGCRTKPTRTHELHIHPLHVLVSKILSSILNSLAHIHPLYHPLSTLSTVGPTYHFI